ncbi:hypothetical protein EIN_006090 [Entamoeba invadens IP1]|uniref:Uncharacterized protein n=1 Tax=Entamoeba invadens IP1 TaxID=370355 RepID=A0A0A1UCN7_ENTIV|nr:hypothetical protein EIN_006090 [Entamoeba invadens IP1]ELP93678.1 hypothetical protein EIN_006090 [Entamoeba invadens IP1]|eukprot:XP_004260449.1 hypothetical protein EIN_006090 [Entamoeba invadens IP1]
MSEEMTLDRMATCELAQAQVKFIFVGEINDSLKTAINNYLSRNHLEVFMVDQTYQNTLKYLGTDFTLSINTCDNKERKTINTSFFRGTSEIFLVYCPEKEEGKMLECWLKEVKRYTEDIPRKFIALKKTKPDGTTLANLNDIEQVVLDPNNEESCYMAINKEVETALLSDVNFEMTLENPMLPDEEEPRRKSQCCVVV